MTRLADFLNCRMTLHGMPPLQAAGDCDYNGTSTSAQNQNSRRAPVHNQPWFLHCYTKICFRVILTLPGSLLAYHC